MIYSISSVLLTNTLIYQTLTTYVKIALKIKAIKLSVM